MRDLQAAVEVESKRLKMEAHELVFLKKGEKGVETNEVWTAVATRLPMRPQCIVRQHARQHFHRTDHKGPWTKSEDDLVFDYALQTRTYLWAPLAQKIGRTATSCSERWRMLKERDLEAPWSEYDDNQLLHAKETVAVARQRVDWVSIGRLLGRGPLHCKFRWCAFQNSSLAPQCSHFPALTKRNTLNPSPAPDRLRSRRSLIIVLA